MSYITFATKAEAEAFLREQGMYQHSGGWSPSGEYHLSYCEESAPDYRPTRYKDGWGIKATYYYLADTSSAPADGRCYYHKDCGLSTRAYH